MSEEIARWFARNIIADEIGWVDSLPGELRDGIAAEMVRDQDFLGWPSIEEAQATLDYWSWTADVGGKSVETDREPNA